MKAPATFTLFLIAAAIFCGLLPVMWLGLNTGEKLFDAYTFRVLTFTLVQATLSTVLSLALGVPAAFALARRRFPGRDLLVSLLALPMALPQIVVVLGLVAVLGSDGWLSGTLPLYGLSGILLAHVFFNASLVARLTLTALQSVPAEHHRLAAQLNLSGLRYMRLVDGPVLRHSLPGMALLVFLLCAASFTIVLTLGGGPQATTLETAIYQSLRFDFDPARATALAMLQLGLCLVLGLAILRVATEDQSTPLRLTSKRFDESETITKALDVTAIFILSLLLLLPLLSLAISGLSHVSFSGSFARALLTSLLFAIGTATLATIAAFVLAQAAARSAQFNTWGQLASVAGLALPPAVIATGWFILAINTTGLTVIAPLLIILLNALLALPYALRVILPATRATVAQDRLAASLAIAGLNRLRIDLRALRKPMILAFAMGFVLSLGDLAAVLFFGDGRYITLPALIYQQMGNYRMEGAIGTALVLALIAWLVLFAAEKGTRHA